MHRKSKQDETRNIKAHNKLNGFYVTEEVAWFAFRRRSKTKLLTQILGDDAKSSDFGTFGRIVRSYDRTVRTMYTKNGESSTNELAVFEHKTMLYAI